MDALEFLKERRRMCDEYSRLYNGCCDCPLVSHCSISSTASDEDNKRIVAAVEQWSKEHPRKTRQSVFLERYPEAEIDANGVVGLCPMSISAAYRDSDGGCNSPEILCIDCRREFWMQEVK